MSGNKIPRQVPMTPELRERVLELARREERSERQMLAILLREAVEHRTAMVPQRREKRSGA